MKLQTKNIKRIKMLLCFTIGFAMGSVCIYLKKIVDMIESVDMTPFQNFSKGLSESLNLISFLLVVIISIMIYRKLDCGKIFSKGIIYYIQLFGLLQIISAIFAGLSDAKDGVIANSHSIIIGILIIIFAQVFRIALQMQQDDELTI